MARRQVGKVGRQDLRKQGTAAVERARDKKLQAALVKAAAGK